MASKCADKYEVRDYVSKKIGSEFLNKLYGVYESVDEIDLSILPRSFVLKCTHGSGYNIICNDKYSMNWKVEFKKLKRWMNMNYYLYNREWVYKDIKPRIICEEFLTENDKKSITDYKFFCFNGQPTYCQVIKERGSNETIDFFNTEWNHMPFTGLRNLPNSKDKIMMPNKYKQMLILAKKLSEGFPFVRVDFYYINNKIIFGEMTFFPASGMGRFNPPEWDIHIGNLLEIPNNK